MQTDRRFFAAHKDVQLGGARRDNPIDAHAMIVLPGRAKGQQVSRCHSWHFGYGQGRLKNCDLAALTDSQIRLYELTAAS